MKQVLLGSLLALGFQAALATDDPVCHVVPQPFNDPVATTCSVALPRVYDCVLIGADAETSPECDLQADECTYPADNDTEYFVGCKSTDVDLEIAEGAQCTLVVNPDAGSVADPPAEEYSYPTIGCFVMVGGTKTSLTDHPFVLPQDDASETDLGNEDLATECKTRAKCSKPEYHWYKKDGETPPGENPVPIAPEDWALPEPLNCGLNEYFLYETVETVCYDTINKRVVGADLCEPLVGKKVFGGCEADDLSIDHNTECSPAATCSVGVGENANIFNFAQGTITIDDVEYDILEATQDACLAKLKLSETCYEWKFPDNKTLQEFCDAFISSDCKVHEIGEGLKCKSLVDPDEEQYPDKEQCPESIPHPSKLCFSGCKSTNVFPSDYVEAEPSVPAEWTLENCSTKTCRLKTADSFLVLNLDGEFVPANEDLTVADSVKTLCKNALTASCNFPLCASASETETPEEESVESGETSYVPCEEVAVCTNTSFDATECPDVAYTPVCRNVALGTNPDPLDKKCGEDFTPQESHVKCECVAHLTQTFTLSPPNNQSDECELRQFTTAYKYRNESFSASAECDSEDADVDDLCEKILAVVKNKDVEHNANVATMLFAQDGEKKCTAFFTPSSAVADECCKDADCIVDTLCYIVHGEIITKQEDSVECKAAAQEAFLYKDKCSALFEESCNATCRTNDAVIDLTKVPCKTADGKKTVDSDMCSAGDTDLIDFCIENDSPVELCPKAEVEYVYQVKNDATATCTKCTDGREKYAPEDYKCQIKLTGSAPRNPKECEILNIPLPGSNEVCTYDCGSKDCNMVNEAPVCDCNNGMTGDDCGTCPVVCQNNGKYENDQCDVCTCEEYYLGDKCECVSGVASLIFSIGKADDVDALLETVEQDVQAALDSELTVDGVTYKVATEKIPDTKYFYVHITIKACGQDSAPNTLLAGTFKVLKAYFAVASATDDLSTGYSSLTDALAPTGALISNPAFEHYVASAGVNYNGVACDSTTNASCPKCVGSCGAVPPAPPVVDDDEPSNTGMIVGICVGVAALILICITIYCCCTGEKSEEKTQNENKMSPNDASAAYNNAVAKDNSVQMASTATNASSVTYKPATSAVTIMPAVEQNAEPVVQEDDEENLESDEPLPANWQQCTTDDGNIYYWNNVTEESCWERPTA